jgi:hypothetical protein
MDYFSYFISFSLVCTVVLHVENKKTVGISQNFSIGECEYEEREILFKFCLLIIKAEPFFFKVHMIALLNFR